MNGSRKKVIPGSASKPQPPKKPGAGTWLGFACALVIAFAWGHSSNSPSTLAASAAPASSPEKQSSTTEAATPAGFSDAAQSGSSEATFDGDDGDDGDDGATIDDGQGSGEDATACDDDSYLSSDGDCVHRPVAAATAPEGASAQCNDGTYSFSEHRRGTCSHHGGVADWL